LKAEAEAGGGEETEGGEGEEEKKPPTEVVLEKLGDLTSGLGAKIEAPLVSGL
jgi:hypothetical protein